MANEEHLRILRSGVKAWNEWRKANPTITPDLTGANFSHSNLTHCDLSYADMSGADLGTTDLSRVKLDHANLSFANLIDASLHTAFLTHANLTFTFLSHCNLSGTKLMYADLGGAHMTNAHLFQTQLQGANLNTAIGWCSFSELSLVGIKELKNAVHEGPSSIGVDTLELTAADLAKDPSDQAAVEIFLEGAGVPNEYISFFRSRIGQSIQFYSAFISYSRKDEGFGDRLYADLRQKNIRCWRDKEDLKIGEKLRQSINDAIRLHEKLIVVLSENSVNSIWVEDEVEMAFEKERRQGGTVLFPIRLDNAVMHSKAGWAAKVRTRHIGDFRTWEDHDHYQKSLARLIRDLQADDKMKPASI